MRQPSRSALRPVARALVLVPEIALGVPLLERLGHDLGTEVALLHSALSEGERGDEWRRIRAGDVSRRRRDAHAPSWRRWPTSA